MRENETAEAFLYFTIFQLYKLIHVNNGDIS